jgi:hypothetical protein
MKPSQALYWGRGAGGISLFNFAYVRARHSIEGRRRPYMNPEPL